MAEFAADKQPSIIGEDGSNAGTGTRVGAGGEEEESYPLTVIYCGGESSYKPPKYLEPNSRETYLSRVNGDREVSFSLGSGDH